LRHTRALKPDRYRTIGELGNSLGANVSKQCLLFSPNIIARVFGALRACVPSRTH
jgi:predicted alpha/beta superfamily hydrolase